jgi:hypothetical protein
VLKNLDFTYCIFLDCRYSLYLATNDSAILVLNCAVVGDGTGGLARDDGKATTSN